jgi:hypothetical protein
MAEPTEADRERVQAALWVGSVGGTEERMAQLLADERERATEAERLVWNPMIGRMLQVTQEWVRLGGVLAAAAEQFHAAIAAEETGQ